VSILRVVTLHLYVSFHPLLLFYVVVNDGLVSTFLLVAGVAGGGLATTDILLTAIAGALAGAVSMCAGEYVATKSQDEVLRGEIKLENEHIQKYRSDELLELSELLSLIGIPEEPSDTDVEEGKGYAASGTLRRQLLLHYEKNPNDLLKIMIALEFGVVEEERRSPVVAGLTSCALFFLGSLPSVLPFIFIDEPFSGLVAAAVATGFALFFVGAIKTWATRGKMLEAAMENLIIAGFGGGFAFGVGLAFDKLIRD
jgi:VIT1/CCC1 family predicted Fe2+/Mn2+ transporter